MEEFRTINLSKTEIVSLINNIFIPYSKMDDVRPLICFDRDGPIWDKNKLKELPIDKLEILFMTIRRWK